MNQECDAIPLCYLILLYVVGWLHCDVFNKKTYKPEKKLSLSIGDSGNWTRVFSTWVGRLTTLVCYLWCVPWKGFIFSDDKRERFISCFCQKVMHLFESITKLPVMNLERYHCAVSPILLSSWFANDFRQEALKKKLMSCENGSRTLDSGLCVW